jgi:hypothetical protein
MQISVGAIALTHFDDVKSKFLNHRQWREFIAAIHGSVTHPCAVTYPKVLSALRSGRAWFSDGAGCTRWMSAG